MDQTLREVIEYYVARGYALASYSPDAGATLVRRRAELRLRREGRWVRIEGQPAPAAPALAGASTRRAPWLALLAAVLAGFGSAALVVIALLLVTDDDAPAGVASPSPTSVVQAPPPTPTPATTSTPTATPTPGLPPTTTPTPTAVPPPIGATLLVADQLLGPGARTIIVERASNAKEFYVVVFEGGAAELGAPLAASALLASGSHGDVAVHLPRPLADGERVWVALHHEQNGNTSFDGPIADPPLTEGVPGPRGPQGQVAIRIGVTVGAPSPPVSGSGGEAFASSEPHGPPRGVLTALAAVALVGPLAAGRYATARTRS